MHGGEAAVQENTTPFSPSSRGRFNPGVFRHLLARKFAFSSTFRYNGVGYQCEDEVRVKGWRVLAFVTELGFTIGFSILLGIGLGWWVDGRLGTQPLFTILGLLLGLASAGYNLYRLVILGRWEGREKKQ